MNNQNNFEKKLGKTISNLPEYEHNNSIWNKIEAQLNFEEKLDNEVVNLSELEYKKDIWTVIERNLEIESNSNKEANIRKLFIYSLSAAAIVVLSFGLFNIFNNNFDYEITYSQEYAVENEQVDEVSTNELDPIKFLEENCKTVPKVCSSKEFKEQKNLLVELNNEHIALTEVINNYGGSPELIKSLIKIENLKSEVLKDLIKTLNS